MHVHTMCTHKNAVLLVIVVINIDHLFHRVLHLYHLRARLGHFFERIRQTLQHIFIPPLCQGLCLTQILAGGWMVEIIIRQKFPYRRLALLGYEQS